MEQNTKQKVISLFSAEDEDDLSLWKGRFLEGEIRGVRASNIEKKIELQLQRFIDFFRNRYGHEKVSVVMKRDVLAWIRELYQDPDDPNSQGQFAAATVNNHKAHLSLFMGWLQRKAPQLLPEDPTKGRELKDILLPAPEPRALMVEQAISLNNICDRLERFHQLKGRRWKGQEAPVRKNARPKRDRAIVFAFISTGIRREMLINLNLDQLQPNDPALLRTARKARLIRIRGKGRTEQTKYLNYDARLALADYLEFERPMDEDPNAKALFLVAVQVPERKPGGRLKPAQVNRIVSQIGRWHDAEQADPERYISPLKPHMLRHTYGFRLSDETRGNRFALQQELGHRNDRYIETYVNPPEAYRIGYTEKL